MYSSYIALPANGIDANDPDVGIGYNASIAGGFSFRAVNFIGAGRFSSASSPRSDYALPRMAFDPAVAGEGTSLRVLFAYEKALEIGDVVDVSLPNFSIASIVKAGPHQAVFTNGAARISLQTAYSAFQPIDLNVTGLALPTTRLAANDGRLRVAIAGKATAHTSHSVASSPAVGVLKSAALRWDGVASTKGAGLEITVEASCPFVQGDTVILRLPGFSRDGAKYDARVFGTEIAAENQSKPVFTRNATWDANDETLTFSCARNQTTAERAYLRVDADVRASKIHFAGQRYPLRVNASNCPTGWVSVSSPGVGLARAAVHDFRGTRSPSSGPAFATDFKTYGIRISTLQKSTVLVRPRDAGRRPAGTTVKAGEAADVVLRADVLGPLREGDRVVFELPGFSNHSSTRVVGLGDEPARRLEETTSECAADGSDYSYAESLDATLRYVTTNHCPNHFHGGAVPSTATYRFPESVRYVAARADELLWARSGRRSRSNAAKIIQERLSVSRRTRSRRRYAYPLYPKYDPSVSTSLIARGDGIGTLFSGALLAGPSDGVTAASGYSSSAVFLDGSSFDACGCKSAADALYKCHAPPSCLLNQLGSQTYDHSPQIGWAADGFPVYGPRGPSGTMMRSCSSGAEAPCLDACGGFYGEVSKDDFVYRYYVAGEHHLANDPMDCAAPPDPLPSPTYFSFTPSCFAGCLEGGVIASDGTLASCSSEAVDGFTEAFAPSIISPLHTDSSYCTSASSKIFEDPSFGADWNASRHLLTLTTTAPFPAGSRILATVRGLSLPRAGVDGAASGVRVSINASATGRLSSQAVTEVPIIGAFYASSFTLSNPFAGVASGAEMTFNCSVAIPKGSFLQLALPGFSFGDLDSNDLTYVSHSGEIITLEATSLIRAETVAFANFNVTTPAAGLDGTGSHGVTLTIAEIGLPATSLQTVASVVGFVEAPTVGFGSTDFGYAKLQRGDGLKVRFPPSADGEADGLANSDAGQQYRIGGALMTVASVRGDVIQFAAPNDFNDTHMVVAKAYDEFGRARSGGFVDVETPGFRPAWYHAGAGTTTLVFRYRVRPGDVAADLDYRSATALGCPGAARASAIEQGPECWIRRYSPTPTADANLELRAPGGAGSLGDAADISVDTLPASIQNVTTGAGKACGWPKIYAPREDQDGRTAACVYGAGQKIAVNVAFDRPVTVDLDATIPLVNSSTNATLLKAPAYAAANVRLDIATTNGRGATAFYERGAGSKDLVFVYHVAAGDTSNGDSLDVEAASNAMGAALEPGYGGMPGFIRTDADLPVTDINYTSFPDPGSLNGLSGSNGARVVVDSEAAVISSIKARDGVYSPGDRVDVMVTWDRPVFAEKNCTGERFVLWLAVDNDRLALRRLPYQPEFAAEARPSNGSHTTRSLTFRYVVRNDDFAKRLDAACAPCSANVETAALWSNATCTLKTASTGRPASLVLPASGSPGSLAASSKVEVTSAPPVVVNVTADVVDVQVSPLGAGDVLRCFVTFDAPVVVGGDAAFSSTKSHLDLAPSLELAIGDGQSSPFRGFPRNHRVANATYAGGSGTSTLRFETLVRAPLGTVRVDYDSAYSLKGLIYRLSDDPSLSANATLPGRGGPDSLGGFGVGLMALRLDTRRPASSGASLAKPVAVAAHRRQTVDLEITSKPLFKGKAPYIVKGTFRLAMGTSSSPWTACVEASNATSSSIADALGHIYGHLAPRVFEQPVRGDVGWRRFVVEVAAGGYAPLRAEACTKFACEGVLNETRFDGETSDQCAVVRANADGIQEGGGALEVDVAYDGFPLSFRGGIAAPVVDSNGTHVGSWARATSLRTQVIDVGVSGSSELAGGSFQLLYGAARTACIQFDAGNEGLRSVRIRLEELPEVRAVGGVEYGAAERKISSAPAEVRCLFRVGRRCKNEEVRSYGLPKTERRRAGTSKR